MKYDIYKANKQLLIDVAKTEKRDNPTDKPRIRMCINDELDSRIRSLDWYCMKEVISEKQKILFCSWLENLACNLHPK
tara:strand:+ start:1528 stop:1761 length:234 start_codon:yes stop_codon:yes gene_type:complete